MVTICLLLESFKIKTLVLSSSVAVYGEVASEAGLRIGENHGVHDTRNWIDRVGNKQVTQGGCKTISNPYGRSR